MITQCVKDERLLWTRLELTGEIVASWCAKVLHSIFKCGGEWRQLTALTELTQSDLDRMTAFSM